LEFVLLNYQINFAKNLFNKNKFCLCGIILCLFFTSIRSDAKNRSATETLEICTSLLLCPAGIIDNFASDESRGVLVKKIFVDFVRVVHYSLSIYNKPKNCNFLYYTTPWLVHDILKFLSNSKKFFFFEQKKNCIEKEKIEEEKNYTDELWNLIISYDDADETKRRLLTLKIFFPIMEALLSVSASVNSNNTVKFATTKNKMFRGASSFFRCLSELLKSKKGSILQKMFAGVFVANCISSYVDYQLFSKEKEKIKESWNRYRNDQRNNNGRCSFDDYVQKISQACDFIGVSDEATLIEIIKVYRKKALHYHPDKGGNREEFKKLVEARDLLKSTIIRKIP
jgi:hypothetical protein